MKSTKAIDEWMIERLIRMPLFQRACKTAGVKADRGNAAKFYRHQGKAYAAALKDTKGTRRAR